MPCFVYRAWGMLSARADNFSMRIWMNPDKLASYSLMPQDVINALNAQNVQVAAGSTGSPPQENSQTHEFTHSGKRPIK